MRYNLRTLTVCISFLLASAGVAADTALPTLAPVDAGMSAEKLAEIDSLVEQALAEKKLPGCVVVVGRKAGIVLRRAYGLRQVEPSAEPMTVDTVFDIASLTKPVATSTAIMQLVDAGKLQVGDRVSKHWPEFGQNGKEQVTVE